MQGHLNAVEAEDAIHLARHRNELFKLAVELCRGAVDVSVVLHHRAHTREAGERAGTFEAV